MGRIIILQTCVKKQALSAAYSNLYLFNFGYEEQAAL